MLFAFPALGDDWAADQRSEPVGYLSPDSADRAAALGSGAGRAHARRAREVPDGKARRATRVGAARLQIAPTTVTATSSGGTSTSGRSASASASAFCWQSGSAWQFGSQGFTGSRTESGSSPSR